MSMRTHVVLTIRELLVFLCVFVTLTLRRTRCVLSASLIKMSSITDSITDSTTGGGAAAVDMATDIAVGAQVKVLSQPLSKP